MTTRFICNVLVCILVLATFSTFTSTEIANLHDSDESFHADENTSEELGWINTLGGSKNDFVSATHSFSNQTVVVAGWFEHEIWFNGQIDGLAANDGEQDIDFFISWMNGNGNWTSALGGGSVGLDTIDAIAVLPNNDLIVAGSFCIATDEVGCELTLGDLSPLRKENNNHEGDAFVARLSSDGEWMWSERIGNEYPVFVVDLLVDIDQNINLAVRYKSDLQFNGELVAGSNFFNVMIGIFDEAGNSLSFVTLESTEGTDFGGGLCVDSTGRRYFTSSYSGIVNLGLFSFESKGITDIVVGSFSNTDWDWAITAGGQNYDQSLDCEQNSDFGILVVGEYIGNSSFGNNSTVDSQYIDFFVAQVDNYGQWGTLVTGGGVGIDRASSVEVSPQGNIYVAGSTSAGMVLGQDILLDLDGETDELHFDVFLGELLPNLTWEWALSGGGSGNELTSDVSIAFDGSPILSFYMNDDAIFGNTSISSTSGYDSGIWMYQTDRDNDGILDGVDNCPRIQNSNQVNYDGDDFGDVCDDDDDNDGISDEGDDCEKGEMGWLSKTSTDHDSDGCQDSGEDFDDDEDTVFDQYDVCPLGPIGWVSTPEEDREGDGCADYDTDEDGYVDQMDNCPDNSNSDQKDTDGDGLGDMCDVDLDGDGIAVPADLCPQDTPLWISTSINDHDQDGCHDSLTDFDDDADGVLDNVDRCERGDVGWSESSDIDDHDGDGCRDLIEDNDDDDDGVFDLVDNCPIGLIGIASPGQDTDFDGCIDAFEDDDDDGDGVADSIDLCPKTVLEQQVGITGCSQFQLDDDMDGVANAADLCQNTLAGKKVGLDGCESVDIEVEAVAASTSSSVIQLLYFFAIILLVGAVYVTVFTPKRNEKDDKAVEKPYEQAFLSQEE